jgi:peptidyl-tRNA hydrolase
MRIVDASNRRDVRIIVSNDHLVTVTDSTGELLDRVTIAEDARLALGPSELVHPGILRANKLLDVERGAPVWLNVPEEEQVVYWVRAAGHAYAALVLPSAESRFHHVISNPAADVQCDLDGSADPRSFAIVVACADETTIRTERLQDRSFSIGGLPPGRTIVSLVSVSDVDGPSHSISTVQLEPGTTTRLFFSPDPVRASLRGTLSGELRLPLLDQAVLQEAVLQLVVAQVRRQDGTTISGVRPRHLEVDKMAKNQAGERYLWDAGDTDPGGYRLQVQPLGYVANAWVEPGQSAAVVLDVPELSELHLAFVDESTGVPDAVTIRQVTRQVESHGEIVSPLSFCRPGGSTGSIDFIGVPGKVAFSVETEAHGAFWHVTEAVVGTHHEVVHMVMASWIDLAFIQDSADPSSFCKWFGQIEVWDSAGPSEPLWSEQRNAGEGSQASVCVRGNNAVDLRFRPDEGYPTLPDLYVAAGLPDPKEPSRTQRRRLLVPVGDSPAVDETSR